MLIPRSVLSAFPSCADTGSGRYALGGVYLERRENTACAVATDGRRLIAAEWADDTAAADFPPVGLDVAPAPGSEFGETGKVIPSADCVKLARAAKPKGRAASKMPVLQFVALEERTANGRAKFVATDGETTAALEVATIEGRYPKWRDVLPGDRPRVSHFTFQDEAESDNQTSGHYEWCKEARKLRAETETKPGNVRGAVVRVRVDARFLAEVAAALDAVTGNDEDHGLTLEVPLDPTCPLVLSNEGNGVKVRGVVMPLRDK